VFLFTLCGSGAVFLSPSPFALFLLSLKSGDAGRVPGSGAADTGRNQPSHCSAVCSLCLGHQMPGQCRACRSLVPADGAFLSAGKHAPSPTLFCRSPWAAGLARLGCGGVVRAAKWKFSGAEEEALFEPEGSVLYVNIQMQ